jgi:thiol-disulfide isomerase/thioredoxin
MVEKKTIILIVALILIAGAIVYLQQFSPNKSYTGTSVAPGSRTAINAEKAQKYEYAKEIADPSGFVNVDNITIGSLIGKKVILVDFWTYSCINCARTIPYLNMWYAKYHDQGLEIIGIHSPEFQFEHDIGNVRAAVKKYDIHYPVVLDNNLATWSSYENQYWPEEYLIDIDGFVVDRQIGEGGYDTTETKIQDLLRERADALGIQANISTTTGVPADTIAIDYSKVGSPETYFGSARNEYLGNGQKGTNGMQTLVRPGILLPNVLYLAGPWDFSGQYAETGGATSVIFQYDAKNVYFVASADNATAVTVMLDGKPITAGAGSDVSGSVALVRDNQLYTIVEGADYGEHTLELDIPGPGLRAYTFTFG